MPETRQLLAGVLGFLWGALVALDSAADAGRSDVYGLWASSGTIIEVRPDGESLSARIVALKHPNWREKDRVGEVGAAKTDLFNPDPGAREVPLLGLEMLSGYRFRKGRWQGKLYLPSNGSVWQSTARIKGGDLEIRGYVGMPMFGKAQKFHPVARCDEHVMEMISVSRLAGTPCDDLVGIAE